jgi:hypothetical protein
MNFPIPSIAGTHTTSATATLLFWNLLHSPENLAKCVKEIDSYLGPLGHEQLAYPVAQVESSLPFLRQCMKENFRITPVFTLPLERRITAPEGIVISGRHIKQGVSYMLFYTPLSFITTFSIIAKTYSIYLSASFTFVCYARLNHNLLAVYTLYANACLFKKVF